MSDIDKRLRGVIVALECSLCEGKRTIYLNERDSQPSACPKCDGTGTEQAVMSVSNLKVLLGLIPKNAV